MPLIAKMARVSRELYHSIRVQKEALGKANVLGAARDAPEMLAYFAREDRRTMSWSRANDFLCQGRRYCCVVVMPSALGEVLVMDVHLGLWRSIKVALVPDYLSSRKRAISGR